MKNTERLAKALRDRDNPYHIGTVIGTVKALSPLTVEIPMPIGKPMLINRRIKVASRLCAGDQRMILIDSTSAAGEDLHKHTKNETAVATTKHLLDIGDKVIISAAENSTMFFILDKVGDWT